METAGTTVFLGDCENRLVLVKIYEEATELPNTAFIGQRSYYGRVSSFRRDKIAQFIDRVRTAKIRLNRHIPSIINLAGKFIWVWYPSQPKTCRNCRSEDHLVKDCEQPGHRLENCEVVRPKIVDCPGDCPFALFGANVDSGPKKEQTKEDKQEEKEKYKEKLEQAKKKQQADEQ